MKKAETITDYKQAIQLTGGLSKPSKMPSTSHSIPAQACITGSKLRKVKGSVCEGCYAMKGFYRMPNVKNSLNNRLNLLKSPNWAAAMIYLIKINSNKFHRWHDSGDLQSVDHLKKIAQVARATKDVTHWLPTREVGIIKQYKKQGFKIPSNLIIRLSAPMVDQRLQSSKFNSMVVSKNNIDNLDKDVYLCPSSKQGNKCLDCRACWSSKVKTVAYIKH